MLALSLPSQDSAFLTTDSGAAQCRLTLYPLVAAEFLNSLQCTCIKYSFFAANGEASSPGTVSVQHLPVPEPLEAAVVLSSAIVSTLAFILQVRCLTFSCSILR